MKILHKSGRTGFTLIELLVVIAIIGILASIILASLDSSRKKGRDARRLADIKQLQLALELYYDQNSEFPTSISNSDTCGSASCAVTNLETPGYISKVPKDPTTNRDYSYTPYAANGTTNPCISYHLGATIESGSNYTGVQNDKDMAVQDGTGGKLAICIESGKPSPAADFNGSDATRCNNFDSQGSTCYDVTP